MFRQASLEKIRIRVEKAVSALYETASLNQKNPNDIVLFWSNAHLGKAVPGVCGKFMVGPGIEGIDDYPRVGFLINYLQTGDESLIQPSWTQDEIDTHKKYTVNLELMIYTHLWEAERSLKILRQLANLVSGSAYNWNIEIPWMTKHDFIRNEIKQVFLDNKLDVGNIIQESYHSQLRNAFAHVNYSFHNTSFIKLNNYRGESWELRIREALGSQARIVESVQILSQTNYTNLPPTAVERLGIEEEQVNILLRVTLRDLNRTLTNKECNAYRDTIYAALHKGTAWEWAAK